MRLDSGFHFVMREVRKMELGDLSDFVKVNPRKYYPVVYSRNETRRLLEQLRGLWQLMESGVTIRTVQACPGHTCVETTMIYLHVMEDDADRLLSPLDNLAASGFSKA